MNSGGCHWQQVVSAKCLNTQEVRLVTREEAGFTNSLKLVHIQPPLEIHLGCGMQLSFHSTTNCNCSYLLLD